MVVSRDSELCGLVVSRLVPGWSCLVINDWHRLGDSDLLGAGAWVVDLTLGDGAVRLAQTAVRGGASIVAIEPPPGVPLPVSDIFQGFPVLPRPPSREALEAVLCDAATACTGELPASQSWWSEDGCAESLGLVGRSSKLLFLLRRTRLVASLDCPVLIIGETGAGKELLARYIHACSPRARSPLEAVNLAAVPETLFESEMFGYAEGSFTGAVRGGREGRFQRAGDGTLFLDEVGDMPLCVQAKLLRVLEDRCIEPVGCARKVVFRARVIAATNRDLEQMVATGAFRADLYYRLVVVTLEVPPLRERTGDIPLIAAHILANLADRYGLPAKQLSAEALAVLGAYPWPGNVRELRNVLEQLFVFAPSPIITVDDLPPSVLGASRGTRQVCSPLAMPGTELKSVLRSWEREAILRALEMSGGNKSEAARRLGITRAALYRKLSRCH